MTPEERDQRTVFCMQLSARIRPRDLEDFFAAVGKVKDVRLITDPRTKRSKGIAYIEFRETDAVPLAIALTGQRLLGVPIIVKLTQAEKNRQPFTGPHIPANLPQDGPMKLYIGSLHVNITEEMLRGIFEPFGHIEAVALARDDFQRSKGYGFIQFTNAEDGKKAMEQLNNFELANRPIKVSLFINDKTYDPNAAAAAAAAANAASAAAGFAGAVAGAGGAVPAPEWPTVASTTAETDLNGAAINNNGSSNLDKDEMDRTGVPLGPSGKLALMAKLAEGRGIKLPQHSIDALNVVNNPASEALAGQLQQFQQQINAIEEPASAAPITASGNFGCFQLCNMFDLAEEQAKEDWKDEIRDDVIEECSKYGGIVHIQIDDVSPDGKINIKCPSEEIALAAMTGLHGRYFSGKLIEAKSIPLPAYHAMFPDSVNSAEVLRPSFE